MVNKIISYFLISIIRMYQLFISPILGQNCGYLPSCSEYSIESIKQFGFLEEFFYL